MQIAETPYAAVNRAFSSQSSHYDEDDLGNPILQAWRRRVYHHVDEFLKPGSTILELNAGTGIDAVQFAQRGHPVLATDLSEGMVARVRDKVIALRLENLSVLQLSFENLLLLNGQKFDYVFSNFGGLNCVNDLSRVTHALRNLVKPGGYVTWVIMPPVSFWELSGVLKGHWRTAFRRWSRNGAVAHMEGEYFKAYYHSLSDLKRSFGYGFEFLKAEGLGALSPPPSSLNLMRNYPRIYSLSTKLDQFICQAFPFNRCADHIIVTFQFNP